MPTRKDAGEAADAAAWILDETGLAAGPPRAELSQPRDLAGQARVRR